MEETGKSDTGPDCEVRHNRGVTSTLPFGCAVLDHISNASTPRGVDAGPAPRPHFERSAMTEFLSPHFTREELACHHCGQLVVQPELLAGLEILRLRVGSPVVVQDGYRCPAHNLQVGGVSDSEHCRGMAADVHILGCSLQQMFDLALLVPEFARGGIGVYDGGFIHVDVRGEVARWARVNGQYVGIEQLVRPAQLIAQARPVPIAGSASDAALVG